MHCQGAGAEAGVATHANGTATSANDVGGQAIDKQADANVSSKHATGPLERPVIAGHAHSSTHMFQ